ncbi:MAG TPA: acyl-CoA dehydrogenase family protein [Thermoplasmata archaeon]|nr:acyl-CoA dehydrogenase family protein [Thermoplasmata archaeon]
MRRTVPSHALSTAEEWRLAAAALAAEVVAPQAMAIDRDDHLPDSIVIRMREAGLFGLGIPEEWGGNGGSTIAISGVLEELAAASPAVAVLLSVHLSVCAHPILAHGTPEQKDRLLRPLAEGRALGAFALTEPSVGSDPARLGTRYRREGEEFVLDGSKMFITNGARADVVLGFATRDPGLGTHGISAFLLEKGTAGVGNAQKLDKLGLRGSETNELVLQDARIPQRDLLGAEGEGLKIALSALTAGRVGIASCALGVARAAFATMRDAAAVDPTDGKRSEVARAYTNLEAARSLVARAAQEKDAGRPYQDLASAAKLIASEAAVQIASRALELWGRAGATAGAPAERILRDARVFPIVEGTTEIQELILGRSLVGR